MSVSEHAAEQITDVCTVHGEGVVWDAAAGLVRFVDIEAGAAHDVRPDDGRRLAGRPREGRGLRPAAPRRRSRRRGSSGRSCCSGRTAWSTGSSGRSSTTSASGSTTAAATRRAGSGWARWRTTRPEGMGSVYRLDPDGDIATVLTGVTISNGLSFAPDGRSACYVDTPTDRVDRPRGRPGHGDDHAALPDRRARRPRAPRRDRRRRRGRRLGGAVGRVRRQPLRRAGAAHRRRPAAVLAGDLPRVRRAGPARPLRDDVPPRPARGRAAGGRRALPAPPGRDRRARLPYAG